MNRSLEHLLRLKLMSLYVEIGNYPVDSPERYVLIQDARQIKKRLLTANQQSA